MAGATLVGGALIVAGCGSGDDGSTGTSGTTQGGTGKPIAVVATTTQLGDIVRQVGGDAVDVHQVLQPSTDPHDYEPRPSDVTHTSGAKVVFESGNELDHWMDTVLDQAGGDPAVVTIAPDHTPEKVAGEEEHEEHGDEHAEDDHAEDEHSHEHSGEFDPHWWHDPRNVEAAIPVIRDALVQADPAAKATIDANADAYLAKVQALDAGIEQCMAQIPPDERKLVTSHDAFNYFAQRYGIDVVGAVIPSQTSQAQPSAGEVAELVQLIKDQDVKAVFPESSINPKLAQAVARQTGAKADDTLYGDTLGPEGSDGDTYLKMEQANANAMVEGFSGGAEHCDIPGIAPSS